jgi:uncharacterized protein YndB with AHSA1/START domain
MKSLKTLLTAETCVYAPIEQVWECWNQPQYIKQWNNISQAWHTPKAENDLRIGGKLFLRMEAKDGTAGFDFAAKYDELIPNEKISYTLADGRTTTILFSNTENGVKITETFEPTNEDPAEFQLSFCQAILNNFKTFAENLNKQ